MPPKGSTNNEQGGLRDAPRQRRDQIEEALIVLQSLMLDADELSVRIDQAMHRTVLVVPVLEPARGRAVQMREQLSGLRERLSAYWVAGQARRWE